jgi:Rod binding domain-containing protein
MNIPPSAASPVAVPDSFTGVTAAPAGVSKVRYAAQQFEALLIGQILRTVRESGGWLGTSDPSGDCATEYAEQQLATVIAQRGGLGLTDLIVRGLDPDSHG